MHGQHEKQVNVFGTICTINAALFFASPLSVLAQVVRTRCDRPPAAAVPAAGRWRSDPLPHDGESLNPPNRCSVSKRRDASSLSVPLCATSLTCAAVWVVYGVAQRDFAVFLSNMPGARLSGYAQNACFIAWAS